MAGDGKATDLADVGRVDRGDVVVVLDDQRADHAPTSTPVDPATAPPARSRRTSSRNSRSSPDTRVASPEATRVRPPPPRLAEAVRGQLRRPYGRPHRGGHTVGQAPIARRSAACWRTWP